MSDKSHNITCKKLQESCSSNSSWFGCKSMHKRTRVVWLLGPVDTMNKESSYAGKNHRHNQKHVWIQGSLHWNQGNDYILNKWCQMEKQSSKPASRSSIWISINVMFTPATAKGYSHADLTPSRFRSRSWKDFCSEVILSSSQKLTTAI